jgi:hypothetical protein
VFLFWISGSSVGRLVGWLLARLDGGGWRSNAPSRLSDERDNSSTTEVRTCACRLSRFIKNQHKCVLFKTISNLKLRAARIGEVAFIG